MIKYIRYLAVICFGVSAVPLFFIGQQNICFMAGDQVIYLTDILSSGNDDYIVFTLLALFTLLYTPALVFAKHYALFILLLLIYFVVQSVIFLWTESASAYQMIVLSIYHCHNNYLLSWVMLVFLCCILGVFWCVLGKKR